MKTLTKLILLLIVNGQVLAEENNAAVELKEYDIEVIIFEDARARYLNNEAWNQDIKTGPINSSDNNNLKLDQLSISDINAVEHTNLKPAMLKHEYKRINNSSEYNVLFYTAWRQAGLTETNAFEIDINELKNRHKNRSENTISGQLKVVLARYLHFYGQFYYVRKNEVEKSVDAATAIEQLDEQPVIDEEVTAKSNGHYPFTIQRRMRSKELHYIDHPLVGILVRINQVKKPKDL